VLTVDLVMFTPRHRDVRTGLTGAQTTADRLGRWMQVLSHPAWAWDVGVMGRPHILGNVAKAMPGAASLAEFTDWISANFDPSLTWKDLDWLRERWSGSLVIKGILDVEDAKAAVEAGADEIVVSNHGARQLDGVSSTIRALPAIADAVRGRTGILLDSGVRSGLDVVRAMALGADGVLIGRAWAFALAARGGGGVGAMLETMRKEIHVAVGLSGHADIKTIDRSALSSYPVACPLSACGGGAQASSVSGAFTA
jgi:L-lactate dehydrogenase (cytochrome)